MSAPNLYRVLCRSCGAYLAASNEDEECPDRLALFDTPEPGHDFTEMELVPMTAPTQEREALERRLAEIEADMDRSDPRFVSDNVREIVQLARRALSTQEEASAALSEQEPGIDVTGSLLRHGPGLRPDPGHSRNAAARPHPPQPRGGNRAPPGGGGEIAMTYIVSGTRVEHLEAIGETLEQAVAAYVYRHGTAPDQWEDDSADPNACGGFVGMCESCEKAVRDDEPHTTDPDGIVVCGACSESVR